MQYTQSKLTLTDGHCCSHRRDIARGSIQSAVADAVMRNRLTQLAKFALPR